MTTLVEKMMKSNARLIICGDRILDRWYHGRALPSQDGCSKFITDLVIETPGGAANAFRSLSRWETQATLYSYATNQSVKDRYVSVGKVIFRIDKETVSDPLWVRASQIDCLAAIKPGVGAVLLTDYDKGYLTPSFIREVVELCRSYRIPCVADCKRHPSVYEGCILKGNEDYWERHTVPLHQRRVLTRGGLSPVVDYLSLNLELPDVQCINHIGAGDCFAAHLALGLASGLSLKESATVAHSAGRVYVQYSHSRPPHPKEIIADMISPEVNQWSNEKTPTYLP